MTNDELLKMSTDERHRRIKLIAEMIDDGLNDTSRFVLVVFPAEPPDDGANITFDVISSCEDKAYVASVLHYVTEGVEAAVLRPGSDGERPN